MPRRSIAAIALLLAGCAARRQIIVPSTEAGLKCIRECQLLQQTCINGAHGNIFLMIDCGGSAQSCAATCPGAHYEGEDPFYPQEPTAEEKAVAARKQDQERRDRAVTGIRNALASSTGCPPSAIGVGQAMANGGVEEVLALACGRSFTCGLGDGACRENAAPAAAAATAPAAPSPASPGAIQL